MTGLTAFLARKRVAMVVALVLVAVAGGAATAAPAFAGGGPSTVSFTARAPGTATVAVTLPSVTEIAYGASASYHIVVTCETQPDVSAAFVGLNSARRPVLAVPNPALPANWVYNGATGQYIYSGDASMVLDSSSVDVHLNLYGVPTCFGTDGLAPLLDTLTGDPATRPGDSAEWDHASLSPIHIGRAFSTPYANQYVHGPANDTYTFTLGGATPDWLGISPVGSFVGTPTVVGPFTTTVIATDGAGHQWTKELSGSILPALPWVQPTVRTFVNNRGYRDSFEGPAYGAGYSGYTESGALPAGLTFNPDGSISGTANDQTGNYSYVVTATDQEGYVYTQQVSTALVDGPGPNSPWVTSTVPAAQWGHQFSAQLEGPAGDTYTYSPVGGGLPGGFDLSSDGRIEGSSGDLSGTYLLDVMATDPDNNTWTTTVTVVLGERMSWGTLSLPHGQIGTPYLVHLVAPDYGSTWTYTYDFFGFGPVVAPSWLVTNPNGTLSGMPDATGGVYLVVTATDPDGNVFRNYFSLVVDPFVPVWSSTSIAPQYPGIASTASVLASGDHVTYSVASGDLPLGLTLNADGTITGSPAIAGSYDVTIQAEQDGQTSEQHFSGNVLPPSASLNLNFSVGSTNLSLDATAAGLAPGSGWSLELHSTPTTIASGNVVGDGTVFSTVRIPAGTPAGAHELILSGVSPSGAAITAHAWFTLGRNGTILAISFTGPTFGLAGLAATGSPDVDGAIFVGVLALIAGAVLLLFRRRRA